MMRHKRLLLIFGCLAAVLLAGYVTLRLTAPRHRITPENIRAIKKGMTEQEAEEILGAPAGDYSSAKNREWFVDTINFRDGTGSTIPLFSLSDLVEKRGGKFWVGDEAIIWVSFDEAGQATEMYGSVFPNESLLAKLRRWLGM